MCALLVPKKKKRDEENCRKDDAKKCENKREGENLSTLLRPKIELIYRTHVCVLDRVNKCLSVSLCWCVCVLVLVSVC